MLQLKRIREIYFKHLGITYNNSIIEVLLLKLGAISYVSYTVMQLMDCI